MSSPLRPARVGAFGAAAILTVILAGCATAAPTPAPSASPQSDPVFATEEEALAAAEEAYAEYLALGAEVASDGGENAERMAAVTTGAALDQERQTFAGMRERDQTGTGQQEFDSFTLQNHDADGSVTAYLCLDISGTDLLDSNLQPVSPPDRIERYPLEVQFETAPDGKLVVSQSRSWSGENFC
ncbi:hypothetical protein [Marisediminicola sp. LYQ134]|uniref:hypothetical protein n=1 Tax=Marisediminicola sp. LYQ134 TaxID=3391061 RepID=UPI00398361E5